MDRWKGSSEQVIHLYEYLVFVYYFNTTTPHDPCIWYIHVEWELCIFSFGDADGTDDVSAPSLTVKNMMMNVLLHNISTNELYL